MNLYKTAADYSYNNLKDDFIDTTVNTIGGGALALGGLGTFNSVPNLNKAKKDIKFHEDGLNRTKQEAKKIEEELNSTLKLRGNKDYIRDKALSQLKDDINTYKNSVKEQLSKNPTFKDADHNRIIHQALKNTFGHSIKNYDKKVMRNLDQRIKEINDGLYQHRVTGEFFHADQLKKANNKYQTALENIKPSLGLLGVGLGALGYQAYKYYNKQNKEKQ